MEQKNIGDILQNAGLKTTAQRSLVLSFLLNCEFHPTVDQVYQCVKDRIPGITVATVYNILSTFVEAGIIQRLPHDDGILRFDLLSTPHHHIYNDQTGEVIDFVDVELDAILAQYFKNKTLEGIDPTKLIIQVSLKQKKNEKQ